MKIYIRKPHIMMKLMSNNGRNPWQVITVRINPYMNKARYPAKPAVAFLQLKLAWMIANLRHFNRAVIQKLQHRLFLGRFHFNAVYCDCFLASHLHSPFLLYIPNYLFQFPYNNSIKHTKRTHMFRCKNTGKRNGRSIRRD